jgi:ELWxxDGT repeat protein
MSGATSSGRRRLSSSLSLAAAASALFAGIAAAAPGDISPSLVSNINPSTTLPNISSSPESLVNVGGTIFFSADDGTNGRELWKSDGTPGGTTRLSDINPGGGSIGNGPRLVNVNGTLFFEAFDGTENELYKLEPPYSGPPTEIDINPTGSSGPQGLANFNGTLFFSAFDSNGRELWKSNGGAVGSGTEMVANINIAMGGSSSPEQLTPVGSTLFFVATDGNDGDIDARELWKTSGSGATEVDDITPDAGENSDPQDLINANGTLFFSADDGSSGRELWKSDGTDNTLIDIVSGPTGSDLGDFGALGATLFFRADDGTHGQELWKSDGGTVASGGTAMVADINTGNPPGTNIGADSFPEDMFAFNGKVFFNADDGSSGVELWKSNGGPLGAGNTEQVADINSGASSSSPTGFTVFDGELWFRATRAGSGEELWKTDGTTLRTANIRPGPFGSVPQHLTAGSGALFFSADDGSSNGIELWKATIEGGAPGGGPIGGGPIATPALTTVNPLCAPLRKKLKKAKSKAKKKKIRGKLRKLGC